MVLVNIVEDPVKQGEGGERRGGARETDLWGNLEHHVSKKIMWKSAFFDLWEGGARVNIKNKKKRKWKGMKGIVEGYIEEKRNRVGRIKHLSNRNQSLFSLCPIDLQGRNGSQILPQCLFHFVTFKPSISHDFDVFFFFLTQNIKLKR